MSDDTGDARATFGQLLLQLHYSREEAHHMATCARTSWRESHQTLQKVKMETQRKVDASKALLTRVSIKK